MFYDTEEQVKKFCEELQSSNFKIDYLKTSKNSFNDICEANEEIERLRDLLTHAYTELQFIKAGYNEFISRT